MVFARNRLAAARAGGPRQFSELRERYIVNISSEEERQEALDRLKSIGLQVKELDNIDSVIAEPQDSIREVISMAVSEADGAREALDSITDTEGEVIEADRPLIGATQSLLNSIMDIVGVSDASFVNTFADFGPENLRLAPSAMDRIPFDQAYSEDTTLDDLNSKFGFEKAWEMERGDQAIVAIFDTGFAQDLIGSDRLIGTYSGDDVGNVYAPAEGHGTMTAGAATANKEDGDKVPYNGSAPDSDVILCRITDSEGQIRGDYITEAWDWILNQDFDKPVVSNHSYGTPLCSGRPKSEFCDTAQNDMLAVANSSPFYTAVYAAGNEADYCGRRLTGLTSGITGTNSIQDVITVGALRFDMRDAQRYSSHGRGDCAPFADPKPNVSFALPHKTYYGAEGGVEIKDMSAGIGGSAGGTSHASPTTAGIVALLQSRAMKKRGQPLQTEEIKQILKDSANQPRATHINALPGPSAPSGWDARFGYGQPDPVEALNQI